MQTVAELLLARADDDATGLLFEEQTYTWREVVQESARRAALLRSLLRDGPRHVGVMLENTPEYLFWLGAGALAGATVVGVNTTRRGDELGADIRHADCRLLVTDAEHLPLAAGVDIGMTPDRVLVVDGGLAYPAPDFDALDADESQIALLMFTSGSTGAPKAVVCSSGRLARVAAISAEMFGITRDEVCYNAMPMFHGNAILTNIAPAIAAGATIALRRRFSASGFLPDVRRFGATYFNYVGRALAYVLATPPTPEDRDNRLRLGFGTEATALDRSRFTERFGCALLESYGSSEGPIAITVAPGTPPGALGLARPGMGADLAIVDSESGAECPRAEFDDGGALVNGDVAIGEIVNRAGAPSFEGYYRNADATAERLRNGWYWSGDLGYRDAAGYFYFAGRTADWLRVDSENFASAPIERILQRHPAVAVAAVYPVPDPRTGDQVMAAVELVPGEPWAPAELGAFLAAQPDLGTKWAPRFVRVVHAMPVTATGKVAKVGLRAEAWRTPDELWWHPTRDLAYAPFTSDDYAALAGEFAEHDRTALLPPG